MSAKVKVAVRVRPMNKREIDMNAGCVVDMDNNQTILNNPGKRKSTRTFAFDHCFWTMDPNNPKYADQEEVFQALGMDILHNAFEGYNACIFAYGQTGSGKSYTMMGSLVDEDTKGIIPRLCDTLFGMIAENKKPQVSHKVEVSYMEIYCEKVKDLLSPKGGKASLKVREHKILGPYVESLSKLAVRSFKDINDLMSEGNKSRTVAATQMNTESSRSHAVFSIVLTQTQFDPASQSGTEKVSKISLVDLAGSERVSKTGALGERLKEGSLINKSLTTLGLVISALADISAGKKPKNAYIPYRDSTLTWLLKDNLGGNSKTVMVATVSPASDNFEETLSTLRYADRAKRIVNHAVINEDPNSRVIRELREEVEKLRSLIGSGGGGGGEANTKEIQELQDRLLISEGLMTEMSKTWEQRLAETERIHHERQKTLENMGISVQESGIGVQVDKFYMVNLNADPSLNELLVCYLKPVTRIGRAQAETPQDIQLRGLGIANEHCIVEIQDRDVFLTPLKGARTLVNGVSITEKVQVKHGGRILLGNNHLYRLSCPAMGGQNGGQNGENELMDYEQAMKEISINELTNDPVYSKVQENLLKKHEEEKEGALAAQRLKYEEQLAKLKEQLESSNVSSASVTSPTQPKLKYTTVEEEWEQKNRGRLIKSVLQANRLVQEANMLAEALHKDTVFKVTLTVPRSFLSPTQNVEASEDTNEVAIRVLHKQRGTDSVWTTETLEEKVLTMREMYERMEEGGSLLDDSIGPDPFYDLEQHALLGVANFYLDCVNHDVMHDYTAPIVAPTGKVCGKLRVTVQRVPTPSHEEDVDVPEVYVQDERLDLGSQITVRIHVVEATGLPKEYSHYVFCQYQFWMQEEPMIIPPLVHAGLDKLSDKVQRFDHQQDFTVEISEDFLDFIEEGALAVEVWGHRRSGFHDMGATVSPSEDTELHRPKSFPERWSELTKHLELSVEMMELNDQGEYVAVEIQSKPDVPTGGVFMIRQGQSRRINVTVRSVMGSGLGNSPLKCNHISSVAVGSMYLRNRYDEPLDSYQSTDLERLRVKWSDALMNRREYLDTEVRKMMDRREQSVADLEKQNELLDQWAMLQWQRAAVLQPKGGSGVPGAPSNWELPPGFESRVPVLFLDLQDDLLTPYEENSCEGAVTTGSLHGEKLDSMISLPIISSDQQDEVLRATASWDSTVHNTNSLNKITNNNDRVYGIIQVGVTLLHPPGMELILRKRICLRVYKKMGFGATLMRAFAGRENRSNCGVMFEVVMGIPKSEGMDPPPKIPANPSFVELDEDENAVEKFKTAMTSISSILHLDRLKQDVALKEKLTVSGKSLRKRIAVGDATTPQSLSRADSGIVFVGSRADSPEPPSELEPGSATSPDIPGKGERGGEEAITVGGGKVPSRGSGTPEDSEAAGEEKLKVIPEETFVGGEEEGNTLLAQPSTTQQTAAESEEAAPCTPQEQEQEQAEPVAAQETEGEKDSLAQHSEEKGPGPPAQLAEEEQVQDTEATQHTGEGEASQTTQQVKEGEESQHEDEQSGPQEQKDQLQETERPPADVSQPSQAEVVAGVVRETVRENVVVALSPKTGQSEVVPGFTIGGSESTEPAESAQGSESTPPKLPAERTEVEDEAAGKSSDAVEEGSERSSHAAEPLSLQEVGQVVQNEEQVPTFQVTSHDTVPSEGSEVKDKPSSSPQQECSPQLSRSASPTPSTESEGSSLAEGGGRPSPPPCSLRERVMVEMGGGFKMGVVKYIGETEFAPGEWIGVAFDKPSGKHNGTVKGVKYFKCKEKHGVFVKRDKIIHHPGSSPGSLSTRSSVTAAGKPPSPLSSKRKVTSNPQLSRSSYTGSARRTSYGPSRR